MSLFVGRKAIFSLAMLLCGVVFSSASAQDVTGTSQTTTGVLSGATLADLADWGALGKTVGERHQNYYAVPVFTGLRRAPLADELKQLGCALASYGSMGMFHMVGVTPEAPSVEAALGGEAPRESFAVSDADIDAVYRGYPL